MLSKTYHRFLPFIVPFSYRSLNHMDTVLWNYFLLCGHPCGQRTVSYPGSRWRGLFLIITTVTGTSLSWTSCLWPVGLSFFCCRSVSSFCVEELARPPFSRELVASCPNLWQAASSSPVHGGCGTNWVFKSAEGSAGKQRGSSWLLHPTKLDNVFWIFKRNETGLPVHFPD